MAMKTGVRLKSAVCGAEVIVVRAPRGYVDLRCGGHPLIEMTASGIPGTPISSALASELQAFCRERLAGFKCPRSVDFVDELPRLPTGKLAKGES
jgi:acyl-CoA synthetase (AMP-forming)/AMP-acid ligase II